MEHRVFAQRVLPWAIGLWLAITGSLSAQQREPVDLKLLPPSQLVGALSYCRGAWEVRLKDGSDRSFKEYDLGFKTDSSSQGPHATSPALVPTGRVGDRALVIFAGIDELKDALKRGCSR
jgi:cytochrome c